MMTEFLPASSFKLPNTCSYLTCNYVLVTGYFKFIQVQPWNTHIVFKVGIRMKYCTFFLIYYTAVYRTSCLLSKSSHL